MSRDASRLQLGTAPEGRAPDGGDRSRNSHRRQAGTAPEGRVPDGGDRSRNSHRRQAGTVSEGPAPDRGDRFRNSHRHQAGTATEGPVPDGGDGGGYGDSPEYLAVPEGLVRNLRDPVRNVYVLFANRNPVSRVHGPSLSCPHHRLTLTTHLYPTLLLSVHSPSPPTP